MTAKISNRLEILRTCKMYVGGAFVRSESGRFYQVKNARGLKLANACQGSRKDFRDAARVARAAQPGWSGRSAFNRGQILYRIGEMLEGRKAQFVEELMGHGSTRAGAAAEVCSSIERLVHYAGWCDKFQQVAGTINPVATSHFNFSVPEPMGIVGLIAPEQDSLLGLISLIAPAIAGGNTCIVLASSSRPLCAVTFAEVLNSSDVPGGVVNILTGRISELLPYFAEHLDVNALVLCEKDAALKKISREKASLNMKRVFIYDQIDWKGADGQSPYFILDLQEIKTTWHPIENIGGGKTGY